MFHNRWRCSKVDVELADGVLAVRSEVVCSPIDLK